MREERVDKRITKVEKDYLRWKKGYISIDRLRELQPNFSEKIKPYLLKKRKSKLNIHFDKFLLRSLTKVLQE